MVVTKEEFSQIKLLLRKDRKKGSKVSRIAHATGWSAETIRCINKFATFEEYSQRKAKKQVETTTTAQMPNVNVNVFEDDDDEFNESRNLLPLILTLVLFAVVVLFVLFK